jgi:hypothetical protein
MPHPYTGNIGYGVVATRREHAGLHAKIARPRALTVCGRGERRDKNQGQWKKVTHEGLRSTRQFALRWSQCPARSNLQLAR